MKTIALIIILMAPVCQAVSITYDPNSIVETPTSVRVIVRLSVSKDEYAAMRFLGKDFYDVINENKMYRMLKTWVEETRRLMVSSFTIAELEARTGD